MVTQFVQSALVSSLHFFAHMLLHELLQTELQALPGAAPAQSAAATTQAPEAHLTGVAAGQALPVCEPLPPVLAAFGASVAVTMTRILDSVSELTEVALSVLPRPEEVSGIDCAGAWVDCGDVLAVHAAAVLSHVNDWPSEDGQWKKPTSHGCVPAKMGSSLPLHIVLLVAHVPSGQRTGEAASQRSEVGHAAG